MFKVMECSSKTFDDPEKRIRKYAIGGPVSIPDYTVVPAAANGVITVLILSFLVFSFVKKRFLRLCVKVYVALFQIRCVGQMLENV